MSGSSVVVGPSDTSLTFTPTFGVTATAAVGATLAGGVLGGATLTSMYSDAMNTLPDATMSTDVIAVVAWDLAGAAVR